MKVECAASFSIHVEARHVQQSELAVTQADGVVRAGASDVSPAVGVGGVEDGAVVGGGDGRLPVLPERITHRDGVLAVCEDPLPLLGLVRRAKPVVFGRKSRITHYVVPYEKLVGAVIVSQQIPAVTAAVLDGISVIPRLEGIRQNTASLVQALVGLRAAITSVRRIPVHSPMGRNESVVNSILCEGCLYQGQ